MSKNWTRKQIFPIFSFACLEAIWRTVVGLFEAGDLVILPIGGLLLSKEVLNAAGIGRLLGFLLLGVATFQTLPEVYPDRHLDWGNDVAGRLLVAGGVVAVASLFNGLVAQLPYLDGGPFAPITTVATLIGVSSAAGLLTIVYRSRGIPQIRPLSQYVRYRQPNDEVAQKLPLVGVLASRVLLILIFGGLALAVVSRLYPLPELFLIAVVMYEGLSGPATVRSDIAEGFIAGLRAIWSGISGVLGVSYAIGGLLLVVWFNVAFVGGIENRPAVVSDPVTLLFAVVTLGVGTIHAMTGLVRLIERLPADVDDDAMFTVEKPVIPGLLVPSALLFGWYVRAPTIEGDSYALSATIPELGIAFVLGAGALVPLLRPSWGPQLPFSDYFTAVLAPSLLFSVWGTLLLQFNSGSIENPLLNFYGLTMVALSPFLGYELFRLDRYGSFGEWFSGVVAKTFLGRFGSPGERTFDLLSETVFAIGVFVVSSIIALILDISGSTTSAIILSLIGSSFAIPPLAGIILRVLLVPLYVPELLVDRLS